MEIKLQNLGKRFRNEVIFKRVDFHFQGPGFYSIIGNNGSGKSTLLKIISGSSVSSKGSIHYLLNDEIITPDNWFRHIAYAAPYVDVPEELSLKEVYHFYQKFKPLYSGIDLEKFLELSGLKNAANKFINSYSSGMKQRVRISLAILSDTPILFLDEPCSNMDKESIDWYQQLLSKYGADRLCLIASNEEEDEIFCCSDSLDIRAYK